MAGSILTRNDVISVQVPVRTTARDSQSGKKNEKKKKKKNRQLVTRAGNCVRATTRLAGQRAPG